MFPQSGVYYESLQSHGVMVAQVILVHFVEVRILVGLPSFLFQKKRFFTAASPLSRLRRAEFENFSFRFARPGRSRFAA